MKFVLVFSGDWPPLKLRCVNIKASTSWYLENSRNREKVKCWFTCWEIPWQPLEGKSWWILRCLRSEEGVNFSKLILRFSQCEYSTGLHTKPVMLSLACIEFNSCGFWVFLSFWEAYFPLFSARYSWYFKDFLTRHQVTFKTSYRQLRFPFCHSLQRTRNPSTPRSNV